MVEVRSDFAKREVVRPEDYSWVTSPAAGVERMMLDRIGDEVARATTIVRFAPGSRFETHTHDKGEEFLVLEGTFSDETGDYPAGSYVRNPEGTSHAPHTEEGATILVKLRQFAADDRVQKVVDTKTADFFEGQVPGLTVLPLHNHGTENVALVRWQPGTKFTGHRHWGGEEIYVIEGTFQDENGDYPAGTWLRSPHLSYHEPFSDEGCLILVKTGHLPQD